MSGNEESLTESRLKEFIQDMDLHLTGMGLGNVGYNAEIDKALSLSEVQMRKMTGEDCALCGYKLQQFALYIQKEQNRFKNIARWCRHNMDIVVAKEMPNYSDFASYDTKVNTIKDSNSYCKALNRLYLTAVSKADELDFVATRIAAMAKTLNDLQYAKRFSNG